MARLAPLAVCAAALLAAACGSSHGAAVTCTRDGVTYPAGATFADACNTCSCESDGTVVCTRLACLDAGADAGEEDTGVPDAGVPDTGRDAGPDAPAADAGACGITSTSTLPGVSIVFPADVDCVFTVAEAAAGVEVPYEVVAETAYPSLSASPLTAGGCGEPDASGLLLAERLEGGGQLYCVCDTGLCVGGPRATSVAVGRTAETFSWMGRNWTGPSDFGNPMGDPFPPGSYTLTVRAAGATDAGEAYEVRATLGITLL